MPPDTRRTRFAARAVLRIVRRRLATCLPLIPFALLGACADAPRVPVPKGAVAAEAVDDFGAPIPEPGTAGSRIISLNPSVTEALFAIGSGPRLVARSKWDTFPAEALAVPSVGDGIRPSVETVVAMRPTLVILYASADNRAAAEALRRAGIPVVALRVDRLVQVDHLLHLLGRLTGDSVPAQLVRDSVRRTLDRVRTLTSHQGHRPRVLWPVWDTPPMVIGGGSYLDELVEIAGGYNVFHDLSAPSPTVNIEEILRREPEVVFTSAASAKRLAQRPGWRELPAIRAKRFLLEDPALTGRPSVNVGMAAVHLAQLLHPALRDSLP